MARLSITWRMRDARGMSQSLRAWYSVPSRVDPLPYSKSIRTCCVQDSTGIMQVGRDAAYRIVKALATHSGASCWLPTVIADCEVQPYPRER